MIGVYHGARTHTQRHAHTHRPKQHCSHMSTLALVLFFFFCHFSSCRYLPFNSIKTFKQPNWKQLPGKIKLHKQNYSDRLRLILGIWALLGSSNNSTSTRGGQGSEPFSAVLALTGHATRRWVVCVCVCVHRSCAPHNRAVFIYPLLEQEQTLNPNRPWVVPPPINSFFPPSGPIKNIWKWGTLKVKERGGERLRSTRMRRSVSNYAYAFLEALK